MRLCRQPIARLSIEVNRISDLNSEDLQKGLFSLTKVIFFEAKGFTIFVNKKQPAIKFIRTPHKSTREVLGTHKAAESSPDENRISPYSK